jgi:cysteine/O-acetylserine efflux protein
MSSINFGALLSFVLITTFTPGPNNISSSSMGILYGYQRSVNYLLGIASGFFGIMLLSGLISRTLYTLFPAIEGALRIVGALYILWLAYKSLKTSAAGHNYPSG